MIPPCRCFLALTGYDSAQRTNLERGSMQENANQVEHPFLPYLVPPEEVKLPSGRTVQIPKCYYCFKPWFYAIPFGAYGHKEVLDIGEPAFAELAILRVLQKSGWDGVWVDSSRRRFRTAWPDT